MRARRVLHDYLKGMLYKCVYLYQWFIKYVYLSFKSRHSCSVSSRFFSNQFSRYRREQVMYKKTPISDTTMKDTDAYRATCCKDNSSSDIFVASAALTLEDKLKREFLGTRQGIDIRFVWFVNPQSTTNFVAHF